LYNREIFISHTGRWQITSRRRSSWNNSQLDRKPCHQRKLWTFLVWSSYS